MAAGPAWAQDAASVATWNPVSRTVFYACRLMNPTSQPAEHIDVYVPLPHESPRQKIHYLHHPEAHLKRSFTDAHGQRLLHYHLDRLEAGAWIDLGFVVGVTLSNLRWIRPVTPRKTGGPTLSPEMRKRYLAEVRNYSMDDPLMRRTAAELVRGAGSDFEKLRRIHDHVIARIRYVRDSRWDPAATVLARGTGSCSEYNYVLSGLSRLAGLPTRYVGGSTSGHRQLPTTDTVFHRWTEVFLEGLGWFPADCSRDANPIRGPRSHFGRLYTDALVWCRQAGGDRDLLGWEYRARYRPAGRDPGLRTNHRTRWFPFHEDVRVRAAFTWFLEGRGRTPGPDLLECAELHWAGASTARQESLIRALARAGRNACLRRAATLPQEQGRRKSWLEQLCATKSLARTILKRGETIYSLRSWYRTNESRLVPAGPGRFRLQERSRRTGRATPVSRNEPAHIWSDLVAGTVDRLVQNRHVPENARLAVMPVRDRTGGRLGERPATIHAALKSELAGKTRVRLVDEDRFNRFLETHGPGRNEFWALAHDDPDRPGRKALPATLRPDIVLVPVGRTETPGKNRTRTLFELEVRGLALQTGRVFKLVQQIERAARDEPAPPTSPGPNRPSRAQVKRNPEPTRDVLVAGGDTVLARWEHDLVARHGVDWPLAGVAPILSAADAALANLECCVSVRGRPAAKGERCPFHYRARPEMLACLTRAGLDVVTAANNHGGDYGPVSAADTRTWCERFGLVCTGIGRNANESATPALVQVGRTRVGIAGLDATQRHFRARHDQAGTHYAGETDDLASFTRAVEALGRWAQGRCHLLVLTIHWGRNWAREPGPMHRKMARIAFRHGVDLILGHSAHRLQGLEVVDGKVVVYDMGNLLFDCKLKPEGVQSALFRLSLSRRGVHQVEIIPCQALEGHTVPAAGEKAKAILTEMQALSRPLGTAMRIRPDGQGRVVGVVDVTEPAVTRRPPPDPALPAARFPSRAPHPDVKPPRPALAARIPDAATRLDPPAVPAPGVELLAYRLPERARERGLLPISTWWRVTRPVGRHVMVAFHLKTGDRTARRGTPWYTRHDPGDWACPLARLEPGQILEDRYPARLAGLPSGPCEVKVVVLDTSRPEGRRQLGPLRTLGTVTIVPREKPRREVTAPLRPRGARTASVGR